MAYKSDTDHAVHETGGPGALTDTDQRAMERLGKTQELKRRFGATALIGFIVAAGIAWQTTLIGTIFSLPNGGPAGAIIMFIITAFGLTFTSMSLAEMASIAPTSGGQYHWASEFSPPSLQKQLSYMVGWTAILAWQTFLVSASNGTIVVLEAVIALFRPGFHLTTWQQGLCVVLVLCILAGVNLTALRFIPMMDKVLLVTSVAAFIAFEATLIALGPRLTAREVFTDFENVYHWPTTAGAVLTGILGATSSLTTADISAHLAEEVQDAAVWVPRCLIAGQIFNYIIGFLMLITFLFRATDIHAAMIANPNMPWVAILENITGSKTGTAVMAIYVLLAVIFGSINICMAASRQLYAFARDGGIPFGRVICKVPAVDQPVPRNAILATLGFNIILACVLMGSAIAFHIIASLGIIFLFGSYMMSISTVFYRRCQGPLPKAPFSLGIWGFPINAVAIIFSLFSFVLLFFPAAPHPDLANMNWACVMFVGLEAIGVLLYVVYQRHVYVAPVERVRRLDDQGDKAESSQSSGH